MGRPPMSTYVAQEPPRHMLIAPLRLAVNCASIAPSLAQRVSLNFDSKHIEYDRKHVKNYIYITSSEKKYNDKK